jgi:hypothetical protein
MQVLPSTTSAVPMIVVTFCFFRRPVTPFDNSALPTHRSAEINGRRGYAHTECGRLLLHAGGMKCVGNMDQRLGRNAADVETGSTHSALLDQHSLQAKLARPDRRHVTTRPTANDEHARFHRIHFNSR